MIEFILITIILTTVSYWVYIYFRNKKKNRVYFIMRKNHPTPVLLRRVKELDKSKFSKKFKELGLNSSDWVYVKCDVDGNIKYRGKGKEYSALSVNDHKIIKV